MGIALEAHVGFREMGIFLGDLGEFGISDVKGAISAEPD